MTVKPAGVSVPPKRRRAIGALLLGLATPWALAGSGIPGELIAKLPNPWPPQGWAEELMLPIGRQTQTYRSEPQYREGYFGQNLYRSAPGGALWTANVLIQDRGDPAAAWRAVSAIHRCQVRVHLGNRARECRHDLGAQRSKTLYYQEDRFYVTLQLSGPGDVGYPEFSLGQIRQPPPRW